MRLRAFGKSAMSVYCNGPAPPFWSVSIIAYFRPFCKGKTGIIAWKIRQNTRRTGFYKRAYQGLCFLFYSMQNGLRKIVFLLFPFLRFFFCQEKYNKFSGLSYLHGKICLSIKNHCVIITSYSKDIFYVCISWKLGRAARAFPLRRRF